MFDRGGQGNGGAPRSTFSVFGDDVVVTGNIQASVDLHIDGRVVDDTDLASWYKEQATNFSKQTSTLHNGIYNRSVFDAKSFKDAQTIQGFDDEPPYGYSEDQFKDPFYADDGNKFLHNAAPEKHKRGRPRKEK